MLKHRKACFKILPQPRHFITAEVDQKIMNHPSKFTPLNFLENTI